MALAHIKFLGRARAQIAKITTEASPDIMIKTAMAEADRLTDHAAQEARKILSQRTRVTMTQAWLDHDAFARYFGTKNLTLKQMKRVCNTLVTLNRRLDKGLVIKVRPKAGPRKGRCKKGRWAYHDRGITGRRTINLCRRWFEETDDTVRGAVIIHELVHATGTLFRTDKPEGRPARGAAEARQFALNDPEQARRNPENYEYFMRALVDPTLLP
jgi:hypothetical protein